MKEFSVRYAEIPVEDIRGRLIRNPNYGGPSLSLNGWTWRPSISNHTKPEFQKALEESIKAEGVRNPILVWSLPEGIFLTFGGSRVKACQGAGIERVPAIINDYTGSFSSAPEVTQDNYHTFFKDVPRDVEFGEYGFDYHYNLERARRSNADPAGFAWTDPDAPFIKKEFPWL